MCNRNLYSSVDGLIVYTRVFSGGPCGGNPCPVVLNADNLPVAEGTVLVEKFGAETILVVKPINDIADFELRYFVPRHEMEMCVHGTIAAVTVLYKNGSINKSNVNFDTALGNIEVACDEINGELRVSVYQFPPQFAESSPPIDEVCSALRISVNEIELDRGPIISVSKSRHKLIVPLVSQVALDSLNPDYENLWELCDHYQTTGFYPFATSTSGALGDFAARQFPCRAGYNEDPATGVAACALGVYLATYQKAIEKWQYFQVFQGSAMGRPSLLKVGACSQNGIITKTCVVGKALLDDTSPEKL